MGAKLQRPRVVSVQALVVEQGKLPRERSSRDQGQLQFKRWSLNEEATEGVKPQRLKVVSVVAGQLPTRRASGPTNADGC